MSGSPFQIPGLGHATPNEHLPAESFAPDLLAAAASICGVDGVEVVEGTNGTQWAREMRSKVEEHKAAAATGAAESAQPEHAAGVRSEEQGTDAMEIDRPEESTTRPEQQAGSNITPTVDQSRTNAGEGPQVVPEEGDEEARTEAEDHASSSQHVAHALEAALDGLLSAATAQTAAQNGEAAQGQVVEAQNGDGDGQPEWEADSSPYESSSSSDSSDSSSDDDSEDEGGYQPLGIEETARLLMAEADGDGDGGGKGGRGAGAGQIRTKNEVSEEVIPKPDVVITPEMKIEPLGLVEFVVERTVVIKSRNPGEVQALNIGSVLCLADRTVIGALAETLGNVRSPLYTVGFSTEDEIKGLGLSVGTEVFYSVEHAQYVFTQVLKEIKGSDASNLHDEEVAPDEMEFSDDEKEAEYKKQLKAKRRGGKAGRGGRDRADQHNQPHPLSNSTLPPPPNGANGNLNYDEEEDGPYKPLARPSSYAQGLPSLPPKPETGFSQPRGGHGHRGSFRGREFRGRGRGGRGDRRHGRGGGGAGGHAPFGYDGAADSPRPTSYGVPPMPQQPQNPHLPPPPYGANVSPPQAVPSNPWPPAPASYAPPPPPMPYSHGQSAPQPPPPSSTAFNFNYQAWNQNPSQAYQYPHQPHHHQPANSQPPTAGYPVPPPAWPGVGAPVPAPPPPSGTYVNPAFFGPLQGQQPQPQPGQHQQYWGQHHGGYGQGPK